MRRSRSRQRGITLIELMISLLVVITGLLVVFRALGSSIAGTSSSSRVSQAQIRAEAIIEAIRLSPPGALTCLRNNTFDLWNTCEATCFGLQTAGAAASQSSCIYTTASFTNLKGPRTNIAGVPVFNQLYDRLGQQYFLWGNGQPASQASPAQYGSTYVRQVGDGLRTWEVVVTVGWNDGNQPNTTLAPDHIITLATGIFQ